MWVDCEMTGLDLGTDRLIEVAVVVTDTDLRVLDEGLDVVISTDDEALDRMDDVVRRMHAESGLTDAVRASTVSLADAEQQVLDHVTSLVPDRRSAPLCGNSVYVDRGFLARDMPRFDDHLHYRIVDVSSVKELARRWHPSVYYDAPEKAGGHRALADALESIAELRYYRRTLFVAEAPKAEARDAAARAATDGARGARSSGDRAGRASA